MFRPSFSETLTQTDLPPRAVIIVIVYVGIAFVINKVHRRHNIPQFEVFVAQRYIHAVRRIFPFYFFQTPLRSDKIPRLLVIGQRNVRLRIDIKSPRQFPSIPQAVPLAQVAVPVRFAVLVDKRSRQGNVAAVRERMT